MALISREDPLPQYDGASLRPELFLDPVLPVGPSRREILVTAAVLTYIGGAVMFFVHAILRHEGGPPISDLDHWLLDSSVGFVALTPIVFILMPRVHHRFQAFPSLVPAVTGLLFALITMPGPVFHDHVVGKGTAGAQLATWLFGVDTGTAAKVGELYHVENSMISECFVQLLAGLPTYLVLMFVALTLNRMITGAAGAARMRFGRRGW